MQEKQKEEPTIDTKILKNGSKFYKRTYPVFHIYIFELVFIHTWEPEVNFQFGFHM
jgi:hypothetical protein